MIARMAKPPTFSETIAASVRKYRRLHGWSVRELSEKCAEAGALTLTQASLTNIERGLTAKDGRGSRTVTVDELFVLSGALGVPAVALMFPFGEHNKIAASPTHSMDSLGAFLWFVAGDVGRNLIPQGQGFMPEPPLFKDATRAMRRIAEIEKAKQAALLTRTMLYGDPERLLSYRRGLDAEWRKSDPGVRAHFEQIADENDRPRPGLPISDQDYVAQWREKLPATYERRLRDYTEALWKAEESGDLQVLPPVPQDLYVDIMKLAAEEAPDGWRWDIDQVTGLPREATTPGRPVLPPNIEMLDRDHDGER